MNTKHTPGPWQEFGPGSPAIYGGDPVRRICVLDRQTGAPMDECYANARLIAAAPALLALAQEVVAAFPALDSEHEEVSGADVVDWLTAFRLQCRAVLANATGAES